MTTTIEPATQSMPDQAPRRRHRFTVQEYHRMAEVGILNEDDRVELINGEIIDMTALGPPHMSQVNRLTALLVRKSDPKCIVSIQNSVRLGQRMEPQPDVLLLRAHPNEYKSRHPTAEDVLLLVEVSDTTLRYDRTRKLPIYARAGIREYWIVNLQDNQVEMHTAPAGGTYKQTRIAKPGESITTEALPGVTLAVDEILV